MEVTRCKECGGDKFYVEGYVYVKAPNEKVHKLTDLGSIEVLTDDGTHIEAEHAPLARIVCEDCGAVYGYQMDMSEFTVSDLVEELRSRFALGEKVNDELSRASGYEYCKSDLLEKKEYPLMDMNDMLDRVKDEIDGLLSMNASVIEQQYKESIHRNDREVVGIVSD